MTDVQIRPARREDFELLCGKIPPYTCQAFTVVYRDEVVALAGVTLTEAGYVMCMEMKAGIDASKIKIWRYAKVLMSMIAQGKDVIYAGADCKYPNSRKFLVKMGFEYFGTYPDGGEIFVCRALKS